MTRNNQKDWIDHLTDISTRMGLNPVRVRWKLTKFQDRLVKIRDKSALRFRQVRYEHRICPSCGAIQDRSERTCSACGTKLLSRPLEIVRRFGFFSPEFLTATISLTTVVLFQYYRSAIYSGGSLTSPGTTSLMHYGANFPPAVFGGDWWRPATYIFLHAGALHLIFNLVALKQIGPSVEELFGKGRTLYFFMVTGILAGIGSASLRSGGVGIGASGAIMGLVGLAAGWGQRDGGLGGRTARNMMLQWGLYTLVFGYFVGADNVAHLVGLASGFVFGFFARTARDKRLSPYVSLLESSLGIFLFVGTTVLVNFPPHSVMDFTPANITRAVVLGCGEKSKVDAKLHSLASEYDHSKGRFDFNDFTGDCDPISAKKGSAFGVLFALAGTPPEATATLTVRLLHPLIYNPETNETSTIDAWEIEEKIGIPRFTGWVFEYPWELVPGEWTIQLVDESEETEKLLVEKKFVVEIDTPSPQSSDAMQNKTDVRDNFQTLRKQQRAREKIATPPGEQDRWG